jgi:hypothetical protein
METVQYVPSAIDPSDSHKEPLTTAPTFQDVSRRDTYDSSDSDDEELSFTSHNFGNPIFNFDLALGGLEILVQCVWQELEGPIQRAGQEPDGLTQCVGQEPEGLTQCVGQELEPTQCAGQESEGLAQCVEQEFYKLQQQKIVNFKKQCIHIVHSGLPGVDELNPACMAMLDSLESRERFLQEWDENFQRLIDAMRRCPAFQGILYRL